MPASRSPPSRGRGSKRGGTARLIAHAVAPFAGAWIETAAIRPAWRTTSVAPFAGAWIETTATPRGARRSAVAPFAGAWIETTRGGRRCCGRRSPPSRGRGSKPYGAPADHPQHGRPLRGGVDRNGEADDLSHDGGWSPPSRGRGSKPQRRPQPVRLCPSPPSRGRGSKPRADRPRPGRGGGRPLRGGVDRNITPHLPRPGRASPPSRGRGSKPVSAAPAHRPGPSPPSRGRGSKRAPSRPRPRAAPVAPFAGAWIETFTLRRR